MRTFYNRCKPVFLDLHLRLCECRLNTFDTWCCKYCPQRMYCVLCIACQHMICIMCIVPNHVYCRMDWMYTSCLKIKYTRQYMSGTFEFLLSFSYLCASLWLFPYISVTTSFVVLQPVRLLSLVTVLLGLCLGDDFQGVWSLYIFVLWCSVGLYCSCIPFFPDCVCVCACAQW